MSQMLNEVTDLSQDSRNVHAGDAFLAYYTPLCDRRLFIDEAIAAGASAVLYQVDHLGDVLPECSVPICAVVDLDQKIGQIADEFYGSPSKQLHMIGVTGTNGKSSCAYYLLQALDALGMPAAMMGTFGYGDLETMHDLQNTTPGVVDVHRILAEFVKAGKKAVVMEVSSHALVQGRLDAVDFNTAIFTNLTRDHLDYHGSMQDYGKAKELLFSDFCLSHAVINVDDVFGQELTARYADAMAVTHVSLTQAASLDTVLIGDFNRLNILCVMGALKAVGFSNDAIAGVVPTIHAAPGRMQRITAKSKPHCVVDYAHTPDALTKALQALKPICTGKLWCIIGCGGDRDVGKRAQMARIAESYADRVIFTNDNPRFENPLAIIKDMLSGMDHPDKAIVEQRRVRAIAHALVHAQIDDVILVAGKGHETYQIIKDQKIDSDDRVMIEALLAPSVSIDTRSLKAGELFVAIKGEHFDGHDYLAKAAERGACAAIVETADDTLALAQTIVADSVHALGVMAARHRQAMTQIQLVALTGSCGKTTTRQFLQSICEPVAPTHASIKSFNNHLGVPLTLLGIKPEHDIVVQEMGANHPGELSLLTQLAKPTVAMITNVAPVHLEGFGSLDGVAKAKAEIFEGLAEDGIAVINADDAFADTWCEQLKGKKIICFSQQKNADVMAQDIVMQADGCAAFTLIINGHSEHVHLKMLGAYNVMNALAAAAAAVALGIDAGAIAKGLVSACAVHRRMRIIEALNGARLLDDSYNANPTAVKAAIDVLAQFSGTLILVMGDMAELGDDAAFYHEEVGHYARDHNIDQLYCIGDLTRHSVTAYGELGVFFDTKAALIAHLKTRVDAQTTLLVKGSLSMAMDDITRGVTV